MSFPKLLRKLFQDEGGGSQLNPEILPDASSTSKGAIQVGDGLTATDGTVSLENSGVTAGSYGPTANVTGNNNTTVAIPQITVDAKGRVTAVTVRTLTNSNTTYTANTGITLSGTTFKLSTSGVSAGSYGPASDATSNSFVIPQIVVDAYGRVTGAAGRTITANCPNCSSNCSSNCDCRD